MSHAVYLWNNLPKQGVGFSPLELFTGIQSDHAQLNRMHVWGCPTYVLEPNLQVGGKALVPKWNKRSRLGQFLGFSPSHSTTVGLIRNITTGSISPQFHCVYDDYFSTVSTDFQDPSKSLNEVFSTDEWNSVISNGVEKYYSHDAVVPSLDSEWNNLLDEAERDSPTLNEPRMELIR